VAASRSDLDVLSGMVLAGTLRPVVDRVYRLEEVREAHRHVETKHTKGKVIVRLHDV
jgi:NADPH:quinone reductase-like Zn-dependent oxidoreductase